MKLNTCQIGDRVCYSAKFLRSQGCYSKDVADLRGTVTAVKTHGAKHEVASIRWDDGDELRPGAATANLCLVAHIGADAAS